MEAFSSSAGTGYFTRVFIFLVARVISCFVCVCLCVDVEFKAGDSEHVVEVEVLFDGVKEMREAFTVHLKPDENMIAETQVRNVQNVQWNTFDLFVLICCVLLVLADD